METGNERQTEEEEGEKSPETSGGGDRRERPGPDQTGTRQDSLGASRRRLARRKRGWSDADLPRSRKLNLDPNRSDSWREFRGKRRRNQRGGGEPEKRRLRRTDGQKEVSQEEECSLEVFPPRTGPCRRMYEWLRAAVDVELDGCFKRHHRQCLVYL